ncbi:hypothetical protein D6D08_00429 [Aureobasidium pullulans]|nr:hypothetical protein D6D08_00429 [Aureobasidium pullulans]
MVVLTWLPIQGIAVPPSPAQTDNVHHLDHASPAHISPAYISPATHKSPAANISPVHIDPIRHVDPVTRARRHSARDIPGLAAESDHDPVHLPLTTALAGPLDGLDDISRPPIYSEAPSRRLTPEPGEAIDGQYHGPSSAQSFLGQALRRFNRNHPQSLLKDSQPHAETETETLSFGDAKIAEPDTSKFAWPEYRIATRLLDRYFEFSSPTYRYMHEPTMHQWLKKIYDKSDVPVAAQACIVLIFASASVFTVDSFGDTIDASHQGWQSSEMYFKKAESLLAKETGPPRLESVQARFAAVQYLLASSRPNKGLFTFGTMIQLMQAVGIHRRRNSGTSPLDSITIQIHRRLFWCAFTMDKYLSIIMGRMPLLHIDETNQTLPMVVNDEDLTSDGIRQQSSITGRDCLLHATLAHVEIGIILAKASQEQHRLPTTTDRSHVEAAVRRSEEIRDWHSKLTPILSGAIHSSSLIPCFRRQHSVLTLARLHAIMFITRPLLLRDLSVGLPATEAQQYRDQLRACIFAARDAIEMINGSARYRVLYPAFWFSQYIAFSAISIIHIYIIQQSRQRIPTDLFTTNSTESTTMNSKSLFQLALEGQGHLAEAGVKSAPVWRYSPILEGLSAETGRCTASQVTATHESRASVAQTAQMSVAANQHHSMPNSNNNREPASAPDHFAIPSFELDAMWMDGHESLFDDLIADNMDNNNLTMDFWPQFDNLPIGMRPHLWNDWDLDFNECSDLNL